MSAQDLRRVVITGANAGIGHQMTTALLDDGYRVAGLDLDTGNLLEQRDRFPDRLRIYACDVTSDDQVRQAVDDVIDAWQGVDILVNNAAIFEFASCEQLDVEDVRAALEVNFLGYLRMIRAVLPHMKEAGGGIIHNVSSGTGCFGHPGLSGYAATKGAIESWTRSIRMELADDDIACTLMHPPLTSTESADGLEMGYPDFAMGDPVAVGRNLADKIESTRAVVAADWTTRLTLLVARWFPRVVQWTLQRTVDVK